MSLEAILKAIPHREPFLLLDEIVEQSDDQIVCRKTFTGEEFWYPGHYPDYPITPGVLLCEAAMQAGAVLLSRFATEDGDQVPVVTRMNNVQFKKMVLPGDRVDLNVSLTDQLSGAYYMTGRVLVAETLAARLDFVCKLVERR